MFQPISNAFKIPTGDTEKIIACKFKELPGELPKIKPSTTPGNTLASKLKWSHNSMPVQYRGACLKWSIYFLWIRHMFNRFQIKVYTR